MIENESTAYMIKLNGSVHQYKCKCSAILVNVEFLPLGWIHCGTEGLLPQSTATKGRWNGKQIKITDQMIFKLTSNRSIGSQHRELSIKRVWMRVGLVCIILHKLVCLSFKALGRDNFFWWILICFFNLVYGFFPGSDTWNDVSGWYPPEEPHGKKSTKESSSW